MPRWSPATATPASSSPSSHGTIRWRSSRSRSCSAASCARRPAAAAHGPARRDGSGAAGHVFVVILFSETLLRPLQDLQARPVEEGRLMEETTSACGPSRWPSSAAPSASRTPFIFVCLGECLITEELRPHQSRPRRHAGDGRDGRLRRRLPDRLALARACSRAGLAGAALRRCSRLDLQAPAGQRHRHRHRA